MTNQLVDDIREIIQSIIISDEENEVAETAEEYFRRIDSIRFIELVINIENKYGIEFEAEDLVLDSSKNFDNFVSMVEKYIK